MATETPETSSAFATFASQLTAREVIGARRNYAVAHTHHVRTNGQLLFKSYAQFYRRLLTPRIRRVAAVPSQDLSTFMTRGANYLARMTLQDTAVTYRNKLEAHGMLDLSRRLFTTNTLSTGYKPIEPIRTLIETFGVYEAISRYHDRVIYLADLEEGDDHRFGNSADDWLVS